MVDDRQMDLFAWADARPSAKIIVAQHRWLMRDRECLWQAAYTPHPNLNAEIVSIASWRKSA